jgi:hypothetical protein
VTPLSPRNRRRNDRGSRIAGALALAGAVSLIGATPALAGHHTIGSISATPTRDTANGDHSNTGSTKGPISAVLPNPHEAEDLGVWNAPTSAAAKAVGGQALKIKIKGCAVEDTTAPSQLSAGTPVNTILFQALAPQSGGAFKATATAGNFKLPFCSSSSNPAGGHVNTGTVTSFTPIHLCLAKGDTVALHDVGGFIPAAGGRGPWYPQGIPLEIIAPVSGATLDSFVGIGTSLYGPGLYGTPEASRAASGFATGRGEQLEMQVIEGTGGDAYGLCPGGTAVEPATSNHVQCDNGKPTAGHKRCGASPDPADAVRRVAHAMRPWVALF